MERAQKEASVEQISQAFEGAKASFLVDYKGCTCDELTEIRKELRGVGASFSVVKNTLAKRAIADTEVDGLKEFLTGPTAVVWSGEDPVSPAKVISKYAKDLEKFSVKAGSLEGEVLEESGIKELASLPSKEELYAKLLGLMIAPATRLAQTMNAPATQLARLLDIRRQELEKEDQG